MMFSAEPEVQMSDEEFRLIRDLIYSHCGLFFDNDSKYLLEKRLGGRLPLHQLSGFRDYYHFLRYNRGKEQELSDIMDILTTNETYFFREAFQLKAFTDEIMPEILAEKAKRRDRFTQDLERRLFIRRRALYDRHAPSWKWVTVKAGG